MVNEQARPVFYDDFNVRTDELPEGGYQHTDVDRSIAIFTRNVKQNGHGLSAELTIIYGKNPLREDILVNLQDSARLEALARELIDYTAVDDPVPWGKELRYAAAETIARYRSINEIDDIGDDPVNTSIDYSIGKLLPKDMPTTIYSPGGKGKSIFADYLSIIKTYGLQTKLFKVPCEGNVLYLDWESSADLHRIYTRAIKARLGIEEYRPIHYVQAANKGQSLPVVIESIKNLVNMLHISLVIIDSQMAATANMPQGMSEAQIASEYYNSLYSLKCTTLTLDHTSKEGMKSTDGAGSPYGSVVKYNRARSVFELRAQQDAESDRLEFALIHQKFNLGRKENPFGIAVDFFNEGGQLLGINFTPCELTDNPELSKVQPGKIRIKILLLDNGAMCVKDISAALDIPEATVRTIINREKNMFIKLGDKWGVLERNETA